MYLPRDINIFLRWLTKIRVEKIRNRAVFSPTAIHEWICLSLKKCSDGNSKALCWHFWQPSAGDSDIPLGVIKQVKAPTGGEDETLSLCLDRKNPSNSNSPLRRGQLSLFNIPNDRSWFYCQRYHQTTKCRTDSTPSTIKIADKHQLVSLWREIDNADKYKPGSHS